jgi:hypothetical protein
MSDKSALVKHSDLPSLAELEVMQAMSNMVKGSQILANVLAQKSEDILAAMLYGRALGIDPMIAASEIAIINGKPTVSGKLLLALMHNSGLIKLVFDPANNDERAALHAKRIDNGFEYTATFTWEQAQSAGLHLDRYGKPSPRSPWYLYRSQMLVWRVVGIVARVVAPDITGGLYAPEEIVEDRTIIGEDGNIIEGFIVPPTPPSPTLDDLANVNIETLTELVDCIGMPQDVLVFTVDEMLAKNSIKVDASELEIAARIWVQHLCQEYDVSPPELLKEVEAKRLGEFLARYEEPTEAYNDLEIACKVINDYRNADTTEPSGETTEEPINE